MFHSVFIDPLEWVDEVNTALKAVLKPKDRLFVPAGNTPVKIYNSWEENHYEFLKDIQLIQIDEILDDKFVFKAFFEEHLPSYTDQFEWISPKASSADVALLGLGLNGHVGFHEPQIPKDFFHGLVDLQESTTNSLNLEPATKGLTYGLGAFMKCKRVILIVAGKTKEKILKEVLDKNYEYPAAYLMDHSDFHIIQLKETT